VVSAEEASEAPKTDETAAKAAETEPAAEKVQSALQKARTIRRQHKDHRDVENQVVALQLKELAKVRAAHMKTLEALKKHQDNELQRLSSQEMKE